MKSFATITYPLTQNFDTAQDYMSVIKNNVINFLLTNTDQRVIRRSKIGIPLDNILFDPINDISGKLSLIKTYVDEFLKNNFVGVICKSITEINQQKNADTNSIDIEIVLIDQNLGTTAILILSNQ